MLCTLVCNVVKYSDCVFLKNNNESSMNLELSTEISKILQDSFNMPTCTCIPPL